VRVWIVIGVTVAFLGGTFTAKALDWGFDEWLTFGLSLGCLISAAAFLTGWRAFTLRSPHRRLLLATAAVASLVTAFAVAITGFFFVVYAGYCEDAGGPCTPKALAPIGLALFGVAGALLFLLVRSLIELRASTEARKRHKEPLRRPPRGRREGAP
jgi:lysylphosphatidylglycerol synthetase-like protein (DUF2156 family)